MQRWAGNLKGFKHSSNPLTHSELTAIGFFDRRTFVSFFLIVVLMLALVPVSALSSPKVGDVLWSYAPGLRFRYKPLLLGENSVVALADDNSLYGNAYILWIDKLTGNLSSFVSNKTLFGSTFSPKFTAMTAANANTIYVMASNGQLVAINANAEVLWKVATGGSAWSVPLVGRNGCIYVVSEGNTLTCVSPAGIIEWQISFSGDISLVPSTNRYVTMSQGPDGTIYLGSRESGQISRKHAALLAIDETGNLKWHYSPGATAVLPPTAFGRGVAFGTKEGSVHMVDHSGKLLWSREFGDEMISAPMHLNGRIWFTRYKFAQRAAPPPGIKDSSPVTVMILSESGAIQASSRRISWGGYLTPQPLKNGTAFVSTMQISPSAKIVRGFTTDSGGHLTPTADNSGRIYFIDGTLGNELTLVSMFAGVYPYVSSRPYLRGSYSGVVGISGVNTSSTSLSSWAKSFRQIDGSLSLTISPRGAVSVKAIINGFAYSGRAELTEHNQMRMDLRGSEGALIPLTLEAVFDQLTLTHYFRGTVSNSPNLDALVAINSFSSKNPFPNPGQSTITISPTSSDVQNLNGIGGGKVSITESGIARFSAVLQDGIRLTLSTPVWGTTNAPADNIMLISHPLYRSNGGISGSLLQSTFTNWSGNFTWRSPNQNMSGTAYFPNGFTASASVEIRSYDPPTRGELVFSNWPSNIGRLGVSGGGLPSPRQANVNLKSGSQLLQTITGENGITSRISIQTSSGIFSGTILTPEMGRPARLLGVINRDTGEGIGFFTSLQGSGLITINP